MLTLQQGHVPIVENNGKGSLTLACDDKVRTQIHQSGADTGICD